MHTSRGCADPLSVAPHKAMHIQMTELPVVLALKRNVILHLRHVMGNDKRYSNNPAIGDVLFAPMSVNAVNATKEIRSEKGSEKMTTTYTRIASNAASSPSR